MEQHIHLLLPFKHVIMKYIIIQILSLLIVTQVYSQDNSFIKIFDNGEWGYEYVGQVLQNKFNKLNILSSARVDDDYGGVLRSREINIANQNALITFQADNTNNLGHSIYQGVNIDFTHFLIGLVRNGEGTENYNIEISKYNSTDIKTLYTYGIENNFERGYGINLDINKDIVGCGLVSRYQGSADDESIVVKIDTLGNEIWTKRIRARYNELKARAVTQQPYS